MIVRVPGSDERDLTLRFGPGDQVALKIVPGIHAIVVGIVVRPFGVLFECNWINDSGLQTGHFADFELDPLLSNGKTGFRGGEPPHESTQR
jgi:hypothetical protein